MSTHTDHTCSCKVGRGISRHDLPDLNAELVRRRDEEDASLRDLADYVNRRLLASVLADSDFDVSNVAFGALRDEDVIGVVYTTLVDDTVSADRKARMRTRLIQQGIDVEELESDWVTHPTVRSHLRDCLDVETGRDRSIDPSDARDTIEWARSRCSQIVDRTVTRLSNANLLTIRNPEVFISIRVTCTECGVTYSPSQLSSGGSCECFDDAGDR